MHLCASMIETIFHTFVCGVFAHLTLGDSWSILRAVWLFVNFPESHLKGWANANVEGSK